MKKLNLLIALFALMFIACDSKKTSIIDSQKMINKQLTGIADSMQHTGDSANLERMRMEVKTLQARFDSLGIELKKLKK